MCVDEKEFVVGSKFSDFQIVFSNFEIDRMN